MKKLISLLTATTLVLLIFSGCSADNTAPINSIDETTTQSNTSAAAEDVDFTQTSDDMFTSRDTDTSIDNENYVTIQFNGNTATASSDSVKISGTTVTITEDTTYMLSGTLNDGMIVVNCGDTAKPQIILNNVSINSSTSAALYILEADKVFVTLADGSTNALSNGGSFESIDENNIDAAVFSKQDLTFNGSGYLEVTSPIGHGITCKDDIVFTGGEYTVNSASHGIDANDSIRISNTSFTINAGKDGFHCENNDDTTLGYIYIESGTMNIEAQGDGISSGYYTHIEDGIFNITAGGGSENGTKSNSDNYGGFMGGGRNGNFDPHSSSSSSSTDASTSMKGIKAEGSILISSGTVTVNSADDAIHTNGSIVINGGTFDIASGDDAIHAEDLLSITSGTVNITESYEGLEALNISVSGGDIRIVSSDDGINAAGGTDSSGMTGGRDAMFGGMGGMSSSNGSIIISGGNIYINASGDGLDANGSLEIAGGYVTVCGPTNGDTAVLDYDTSGIITGGTFIGTGASMMAQTFSDSDQGVIAVSVGSQSAGTSIKIENKSGETIISYTPELSFQIVIFSSPEIEKNKKYTITVGNSSAEVNAS